jgi:hypothetical protein
MLSTQPDPPPFTHCIDCVLIHTGKGGGGEVNQREGRGAVVHLRGVENTNMTVCISSF